MAGTERHDDDRARARSAVERMIERDLVTRGIRDPEVLRAMRTVPREAFVERRQARSAYDDRPLPIGEGQTISQPYIVAFMAEALRLRATDRVLDVGTGSGYAAAVMGSITGEVWSIERYPALARVAAERLAALGFDHVHVVVGDGSRGLPEHAPFDAISVAAAARRVPPALVEQLADGGRLIVPLGDGHGHQQLVLVERHGDQLTEQPVLDVRFVPLVEGPPSNEHADG